MLFEVQRREYHGWTVLTVMGELDLAAVPRVRQSVIAALGPASPTRASADPGLDEPLAVALDLSGVDFIDSAGLAAVLGAVRRVRTAGGQIVIVARSDHVLDVFALTGLDQIITLVSALEQLAPPAVVSRPTAVTYATDLTGDGGGARG